MSIRAVTRHITSVPTMEGAGVHLRRAFGFGDTDETDPFLLFDDFRNDLPDAYRAGFPWHPHRGIETITYVLAGTVDHADSLGNAGAIGPGDVQWMTAGRGIVHSEMPEQEDGLMWGFQLWVNLPAKDKMTAPRYQDIAPDQVPQLRPADGVELRVLTGRVGEVSGPVTDVATAPIYIDVRLQPGAQWTGHLPERHNGFVYVYDGAAIVGEGDSARTLPRGELGVLSHGETLTLAAGMDAARLILVAGKPLNEPVVKYGPFVMNTPEQIVSAIGDFQSGRFV